MRTPYWSPFGYNVSHQLLYLAHLSNIARSRGNHACRCGEVNDFECAHWSNYFGNRWSVGDFSTQPSRDGVWKKQEKTSSESQFWVQVCHWCQFYAHSLPERPCWPRPSLCDYSALSSDGYFEQMIQCLSSTMNNLKVVSWTWHIGSLYKILSSTQYSTIWVSWNRRLRSWMLQPIKCTYCFVLVVVFTFDSSLGWQSRMSKRILHSCRTTVPLRHDLGWIINT